jgi:hypothetical protein
MEYGVLWALSTNWEIAFNYLPLKELYGNME